jgi:hypothetical protein
VARTPREAEEPSSLAFAQLLDHGNRVAEAYGLAFSLPDDLRGIYIRFGIDLAKTRPPAPAAVMNAIRDALRPAGVERLDMPATPEQVWQALQRARPSP